MKIATWNVNGIRAREAQLQEWVARERPDILCLQEIKATPDQVPASLCAMEGYHCYWHGARAYSGVGLHVRQDLAAARPTFVHPSFDFENRIAAVEVAGLTVASVYVPNGGKDLPAKLRFFDDLTGYAAASRAAGKPLVICGDLNIARSDQDVHPKERKPLLVGQLPQEREAFARLLSHDLVDVARALHPDDDQLFTWWAPWRNLRQRNIGWRIDYVLATTSLASKATSCVSYREVGTSDHAPVVASFDV
jgi:exodeoxyribonuclease III